jgi:mono/diheme cytochrome c family protein
MKGRRRKMRIVPALFWASATALVVVLSASIAQSNEGAVAAATPVEVRAGADDGDRINGRKVFLRENCYICHGGRGGGGMCPSLREDPPGESDIDDVIEEGTPNGMPSYRGRVSEREIEDLAAYFESFRSSREPTFTHWWEPGVPSR